ncbi:MAG: NAD/FAD-utilizing enzyme [Porticoccaceae bacterium]|nr:NAD/FAD-utilizing enzyme [Porticoccaceae bacterium]
MKRHYFISTDLDDLDQIEAELENKGFVTPQIHVLSRDDAGVAAHEHLHEVEAVMRTDVVRSMKRGAVVGLIAAPLVLVAAYYLGLPDKWTWVPFICLSIVVLGFCTWEGGFFGIQEPHNQFRQFEQALDEGKHVLFVDCNRNQQDLLDQVVQKHQSLVYAGEDKATAAWFVKAHYKFKRFTEVMP